MNVLIVGSNDKLDQVLIKYLTELDYSVNSYFHPVKYLLSNTMEYVYKLKNKITESKYDVIIYTFRIVNKEAEKNKDASIIINSYMPHLIDSVTEDIKTKIIYISTDCIFSGEKGQYSETDNPDGKSIYAKTKTIGELLNSNNLTIRTSVVGPNNIVNSGDIFSWFMRQKHTTTGYPNAMWSGVTSIVLAKAIDQAIKQNLSGLYHLVNNNVISKFDLLELFNKHFRESSIIITKKEDIIIDRSLINNREDFDFKVPSYNEMIIEMKNYIFLNRRSYNHYFNNKEIKK